MTRLEDKSVSEVGGNVIFRMPNEKCGLYRLLAQQHP